MTLFLNEVLILFKCKYKLSSDHSGHQIWYITPIGNNMCCPFTAFLAYLCYIIIFGYFRMFSCLSMNLKLSYIKFKAF